MLFLDCVEYVIIKLKNNELYLIYKTIENIGGFYEKLEEQLKEKKYEGMIYVDQLAIAHNNENRFFKIPFDGEHLEFDRAKHFGGNDELKKITTEYFYRNQKCIENTILYKSEIDKILNQKIV